MKKRYKRSIILLIIALILSFLSSACTRDQERRVEEETPKEEQREEVKKPPIPKQLHNNRNVVVYVVEEGRKKEIDIEEYVTGVLGGEIHNDWPEEALKAQAILARTFVMEFLTDKTSKYEGADVSTDIAEAQAWDQGSVNERLKKAVQDTTGMVAVYNGQYIKAWFHSHAGGKTASAKEGLNYEDEEPTYIQVVDSPDSEEAPKDDAQWTGEFTKAEVIQAANKVGRGIKSVDSISIGEKGPSGRAVTLKIGDVSLSAPEFRKAIGSMKMKSTLISEIKVQGDRVVISGKGYGHGVGMSQWGAYGMAKEGKTAEEIIKHYFKDVSLVKLWD